MMVNDLVKKLRRACSPECKKKAALEISKNDDKKSFQELYNMVNGARISFIPYQRYSLEDQLIGIEVLGESGRQEALDFLVNLYTPKITHHSLIEETVAGEPDWDGVDPRPRAYTISPEKDQFNYINAKGRLKKILKYDTAKNPKSKEHEIIRTAIKNLITCLRQQPTLDIYKEIEAKFSL